MDKTTRALNKFMFFEVGKVYKLLCDYYQSYYHREYGSIRVSHVPGDVFLCVQILEESIPRRFSPGAYFQVVYVELLKDSKVYTFQVNDESLYLFAPVPLKV
jgi:hypothetical protein